MATLSAQPWWCIAAGLLLFTACGEPMYENAGSAHSLIEDREACAMEVDQSAAADAYRQNPAAHPEYPIQALENTSHCIEKKGWRLVRSQPEQEQVREAVTSELAQPSQSAALTQPKSRESLARAVEGTFTSRR